MADWLYCRVSPATRCCFPTSTSFRPDKTLRSGGLKANLIARCHFLKNDARVQWHAHCKQPNVVSFTSTLSLPYLIKQ
jgi:hypothetical protein